MRGNVKDAQKELDDRVLGKPGVAGTAIGLKDGSPCLKVYLTDDRGRAAVPTAVRGIPVVVETTGAFRRQ